VKLINVLLKKDKKFEWKQEIQREFIKIKHAINLVPVLVGPKFDQDFIIY
jgi:hypothetical protein